jgi:aminopeptidase N
MKSLFLLLAFAVAVQAAPLARRLDNPTEFIRRFEAEAHRGRHPLDQDTTHSYDMLALSLDYRVETTPTPITGWAYLTLVAREPLTQIVFNAPVVTVSAVNIEDAAIPFTQHDDSLYIQHALAVQETVTLAMNCSAPIQNGAWAVGYHVAQNHVFTFAEPYGARNWYPCFDQPFDKFNEVTVAVNMPDIWTLASNGERIETTFPSAGRKREVYHHNHPISTYLVMMAAGRFSQEYHTVNGINYRYFALPGDSLHASVDWQRTPDMVQVYSEDFGPYPFESYGMVQANILGGWGAMEHQTFTTYGNHMVDGTGQYEPVAAHELAHMWFGDHLTCVDFRNIWLNEGFATYCASLFYEVAEGEQVFQSQMNQSANNYFNEDAQFRYAMYDPPDAYMFGNVEYDKGGWVLHMLRKQLLGDSLFFRTMRTYQTRFANGTVSTEDFISVVNETAGQNLHWFFDQWVYQAGHPEIQIWIQPGVPTATQVTMRVRQIQTNAPIFRLPLLLNVTLPSGMVQQQAWFDQQDQTNVLSFAGNVQSAVLNAIQPLLYAQWDAAPERAVPLSFSLGEIYPNPFNSVARLPLELTTESRVRAEIFDVNGRHVMTLADERMTAGKHELTFSAGSGMASGVYLIHVEMGGLQKTVKALLLR